MRIIIDMRILRHATPRTTSLMQVLYGEPNPNGTIKIGDWADVAEYQEFHPHEMATAAKYNLPLWDENAAGEVFCGMASTAINVCRTDVPGTFKIFDVIVPTKQLLQSPGIVKAETMDEAVKKLTDAYPGVPVTAFEDWIPKIVSRGEQMFLE